MTKELAQASAQYAVAEMLLSGVTSFCDMYYFEDAIAEVVAQMGHAPFLVKRLLICPRVILRPQKRLWLGVNHLLKNGTTIR